MPSWLTILVSVGATLLIAGLPMVVGYGALRQTVTHLRDEVSKLNAEIRALSTALGDLRVELALNTGTHTMPRSRG